MMHFLELLGMNCLVSTITQIITHYITKAFTFFQKQKLQWRLFANEKMKSLKVLKKKWLVIDVSKVGQGSAQKYVDSSCVVTVIDEQGEAIGRLHQTIQNVTKNTNIMTTTTGGTGQDLHNMGK